MKFSVRYEANRAGDVRAGARLVKTPKMLPGGSFVSGDSALFVAGCGGVFGSATFLASCGVVPASAALLPGCGSGLVAAVILVGCGAKRGLSPELWEGKGVGLRTPTCGSGLLTGSAVDGS